MVKGADTADQPDNALTIEQIAKLLSDTIAPLQAKITELEGRANAPARIPIAKPRPDMHGNFKEKQGGRTYINPLMPNPIFQDGDTVKVADSCEKKEKLGEAEGEIDGTPRWMEKQGDWKYKVLFRGIGKDRLLERELCLAS